MATSYQILASRVLDVLWRALSARAAACGPGLASDRAIEVSRWRATRPRF